MTDENKTAARAKKNTRTRKEIERDSSKGYYGDKLAAGKVNLRTFVDPQTSEGLQKLKDIYNVSTVGDVIDMLTKNALAAANKS